MFDGFMSKDSGRVESTFVAFDRGTFPSRYIDLIMTSIISQTIRLVLIDSLR